MSLLEKILGFTKTAGLASYRKGIRYFNANEYEQAIQCFEQVLAERHLANSLEANLAKFYCGRAYINVGITKFARNDSEQALGYFQKALKFNPQDTDLHYFIGICFNNVGRYQDAMDSFSKIIETEPWNIPTKLKIAIIFHNMGMWQKAEEIHRAILKKHPDFADIHYYLGLSLMSQGKTEAAEDSLTRALAINPDYTQARLKLAIVHICLNRMDRAEENLHYVISRHPEYADVHYLKSLVKEKKNDLPKSIHHLNMALEISPQFKNALAKLIIIYCRTGDTSAAEKQIEKALSFYPKDKRFLAIQKALKIYGPEFSSELPAEGQKTLIDLEDEHLVKELRNEFHRDLDIMPNVAEIISMFNSSKYLKDGNSLTDFLIPFITEQINRHPTYPDLYNSLGTQLLVAEKHLEAENAFAKALELNPDYVAARMNLMKTQVKNKKYEEALANGNYLLDKDLPFPDLYYTLAEIQIQLRQHEDAMVNAKRVLRLRPGMNKARLLQAKIYRALNDTVMALKTLDVFLDGPTDPKNEQEARQMIKELKNAPQKGDKV